MLKTTPPTGKEWVHEVKFYGWRAQLFKDGDVAKGYSRKGYDLTKRFPDIHAALEALPCQSAILDAEVVVCNPYGKPGAGSASEQGQNYRQCLEIYSYKIVGKYSLLRYR